MQDRRLSLILIICFSFCTASCFFMADRLLVVKGNLFELEEKQFDDCRIKLFLSKNDSLISQRKIKQNFQVDFTVSPINESYYFIIECPKYEYSYKSEEYKISKNYLIDSPINLGQIQFK